MNQLLKSIAVIGIISVSLSIAYYYSVYLPERHRIISDQQQEELLINESKEQANDIFEKNMECEKYKDEIVKKINLYNISQKPGIRDSNNAGGDPINHLYIERNEFKEIFYSPKVNSCVYLETSRTLMKSDPYATETEPWSVSFEYYKLIDALSDKEMESVFTINRSEAMNSYDDNGRIVEDVYDKVDDMVNKYKNI